MPNPSESHPDPSNTFDQLLNRPVDARIREFKYRFAQSIVFGLPVIALQAYGRSLGGSVQESQRWVSLLQALLAGWVTYVGATGMLAESLFMLVLSRRFMIDLPVSLIAVLMYLFSAISVVGILFTGHLLYTPMLFHWIVALLAGWCGIRWRQLSGSAAAR